MDTFAYGLGVMDYIMISLVLLIFVACGIFFSHRDRDDGTVRNYLLGNKLMSVIPVAVSVVATRYNAVGMTGGVGEVYAYGVEFTIAKYASAIGNILAAFIIIPVFHGMDYVSMYEYMEKRFSRVLRLIFAAIYLIGETIYMSLVLYIPAVSLSTVTGISLWISIFGSGTICIFYSSLGGTKAVIWTDVIQTTLMIGCFLMIIIKGTIDVGSPARVWDLAVTGKRVTTYTLHEDPHTRYSVWSLIVDGIVMSVATLVTKQAVVQRFLSVKDKAAARSVTFLSAWVTMFFAVLVGAAGVVVYANYYNCDPITDKNTPLVKTPDQILVFFASTSLHAIPGLQGLAIAGIFSGSLSTLSSFINSFAAITVEDFIKIMNPNWLNTDYKSVLACKILTVFYGIVAIALAFVVPQLGGVIKMASTIKGATVGPLFGILLLGMLIKKANNKGAIFGLLFGLALNLWIIIGSLSIKKKNPPLPVSTEGCFNSNSSTYNDLWNNETSLKESVTTMTTLLYNTSISILNQGAPQPSNKTIIGTDRYSFPLYNISFMWYGPLAAFSTLLFGILASLLTGGNKNVDERLLSPVIWKSKHIKDKMENDLEGSSVELVSSAKRVRT